MRGIVTFLCNSKKIMDEWHCHPHDAICAQHNADYHEALAKGWLFYHEVEDIRVILPTGTIISPDLNLKVYMMDDIKDPDFQSPDWPIYLTGGGRAHGADHCCADPDEPHFSEIRFNQPSIQAQKDLASPLHTLDWSNVGGVQYWDKTNFYGQDKVFSKGYIGTIRYEYNETFSSATPIISTNDNDEPEAEIGKLVGLTIAVFIMLVAVMAAGGWILWDQKRRVKNQKYQEDFNIVDVLDLHLQHGMEYDDADLPYPRKADSEDDITWT